MTSRADPTPGPSLDRDRRHPGSDERRPARRARAGPAGRSPARPGSALPPARRRAPPVPRARSAPARRMDAAPNRPRSRPAPGRCHRPRAATAPRPGAALPAPPRKRPGSRPACRAPVGRGEHDRAPGAGASQCGGQLEQHTGRRAVVIRPGPRWRGVASGRHQHCLGGGPAHDGGDLDEPDAPSQLVATGHLAALHGESRTHGAQAALDPVGGATRAVAARFAGWIGRDEPVRRLERLAAVERLGQGRRGHRGRLAGRDREHREWQRPASQPRR